MGNFIEGLTWDEVNRRIASGTAAILPIGAGAKEHGFHLPMNTDRIQAEWFATQIAGRFNALIWPTVTYGLCRICGEHKPVGAAVRGPDRRDRHQYHRLRLPRFVRARYRRQHATAGRSGAGAS
jgi:Creatinine amidohydrolase